MPLVNRSETSDVQWPEWKVDSASAPPPPAPNNSVEALSPGLADGDSWSESKLREAFAELHEGDSYELSGKVTAKAGEGGMGSAKLRAEREEDGSLKLSVSGEGAFIAGGTVKLGAGTTYRFPPGHDAEAADLADALVKGAVVVAAPLGTQVLLSLALDGSTPDRLASRIGSYSDQLSTVKADASLGLHLEHESKLAAGFESFDFGKVKAEAEAKEGFAINLEKGTFTVDRTVGLEGEASLNIPTVRAGVKAGASATLSAEFKMSPAMKQALADGSMSPAEAWGQLATRSVPDKLTARVEIESTEKGIGTIAGLSTKTTAEAEVELDVAAFLEDPAPGKILEDLSRAKWSVETESGVGPAFALGVSLGEVKVNSELTAQRKHRWEVEGLPFAEAAQRLAHPESDQHLLEAQRALATR